MNLVQAFLELSQEVPVDHLPMKARLDRAYDIVRMPGYEINKPNNSAGDDVWTVEKASTSVVDSEPQTYTVVNGACSCPDGATALGGLCKHVLATRLLTLMAQEDITVNPPQAYTASTGAMYV